MGAPLNKTRTILDTVAMEIGNTVTLEASRDKGSDRFYLVSIPKDIYDDMGRPAKVTLTLELGDALNDPTHPSFSD